MFDTFTQKFPRDYTAAYTKTWLFLSIFISLRIGLRPFDSLSLEFTHSAAVDNYFIYFVRDVYIATAYAKTH